MKILIMVDDQVILSLETFTPTADAAAARNPETAAVRAMLAHMAATSLESYGDAITQESDRGGVNR